MALYLPLYLSGTTLYGSFLTAQKLHTLIGTVVYFISLLTIYQMVAYFFQRKEKQQTRRALGQMIRKCAPPAFWYFAIVLGIPFLNRAYQNDSGKFLEFAALITTCCAAILFLYCLVLLVLKLGTVHK